MARFFLLILYCLMVILRFRSFCLNPQNHPGQRLPIIRRIQRTGRYIPRKVCIHARPAVLRIRSCVIQLDGFRIDHNVGTVVQKRDDGTASLLYDLHRAGLRIDLHTFLASLFLMLIMMTSCFMAVKAANRILFPPPRSTLVLAPAFGV